MISPSPMIGAVIVARMKSSRLPGKSMVDIAGRPALEWLIRRVARSRHVRRIVIATTADPADAPLAELAGRLEYLCFRGSADDVLGRVCGAIRHAGLDIAVHVTGDCPLVDPQLVDATVDLLLAEKADYASLDFDAYPQGLDVEVFTTEALGRVEAAFTDPWIREHVTEPLYTKPDRFRAVKLPAPPELRRPAYRICIDTPQDHVLVREIFRNLLPAGENFTAGQIVALLDARPDLAAINAAVKQKKYRCGVIGLGGIGAAYDYKPSPDHRVQTHAGAYLRYGKTQLAAACDPDPRRRGEFINFWKMENVYENAADMLAREKLDIVSVATPPETHADLCRCVIEAGVRVIFCEKPFVLDPAQGRQVIQLCQRHNVMLAVNHWMRYSALYRSIRDFIQSGQMGEIQCVRGHYSKGAMNSGSHAVDLLRFLVGEIAAVRATESLPLDTGEANLGGVLEMAAGFPAHLTVSDYRAHFSFQIEIIGTRAALRSADDMVTFWSARPSGDEPGVNTLQPAPVPFATGLGTPLETAVAELVAFLDNGQRSAACAGADGLRAVEVIHALQRSWSAGGEKIVVNV